MDLFGKNVSLTKECITPHKISLLVLISELCQQNMSEDQDASQVQVRQHRHALALLLLNLTQATDIELGELQAKLNEVDETKQLSGLLLERLTIIQYGESNMCDFFLDELDDLLNPEGDILLTRTSFFGLFVRKMLLLFNKMSFGQVLHLTSLLKHYVMDASLYGDDMEKKDKGNYHQRKLPVSSRQAENFLTKQAMLIQSNEHAADSPYKLQQKIMTILEGAPELTEAYFVQYLNYIRVGEFNSAIDCLYHYFDRKQWDDSSTAESDEVKKERCKRFCYAALNLAILHTHFNHREEALTALQESIRIAQESNDHTCLAHGLRLLYTLNQDGDSHAKQILERFRARVAELKFPYLESLSYLLKAKQMLFEGASPPRVLSAFNEVNVMNSEKSLLDLSATTHVQQAACFEVYGRSNMAVVICQFPLHEWRTSLVGANILDGKSVGIINSEATIHALCYLASHVYKQGNFTDSMKLLDCAKDIHSESSKYSKRWKAEKQKIYFDQTLVMEDWKSAEEAVNNLRVYEPHEADLRSARLKIKKELYDEAHKDLRKLLDYFENNPGFGEEERSREEFKANIYLALGELHIAVGDYPASMSHLLKCKAICDAYNMRNLAAIASLFIIEVQLQLNLPEKAYTLINQIMVQVLGHGSLFPRCNAKLLLIRCDLVLSQTEDNGARKAVLLSALSTLDTILKGFKQIQASAKIKEVLFYQAFIYNELGYTNEQNRCAVEFRSLCTNDAT